VLLSRVERLERESVVVVVRGRRRREQQQQQQFVIFGKSVRGRKGGGEEKHHSRALARDEREWKREGVQESERMRQVRGVFEEDEKCSRGEIERVQLRRGRRVRGKSFGVVFIVEAFESVELKKQ
jgi:hypothetical protein